MPRRKFEMRLFADAMGRLVPARRPRWQRELAFAGGAVGKLTPIILEYSGARSRAARVKEQLERYGYRVTVRYRKRERERERERERSSCLSSEG